METILPIWELRTAVLLEITFSRLREMMGLELILATIARTLGTRALSDIQPPTDLSCFELW